jgi:hypothetical protein
MNTQDQTTLDFIQTRSRRTDGDTSREAAKHAASCKADRERRNIIAAVKSVPEGLTAREVGLRIGLEYVECQRRISECGLTKTSERRDGCYVWSAVE